MLRVFNRYLPISVFAFLFADLLLVVGSTAFSLRNQANGSGLPSPVTVIPVFVAALLSVATLYLFDVYDLNLARHANQVSRMTLRAVGVGALLLAPLVVFILPAAPRTRSLETALMISLLFVCLYRTVYAQWAGPIRRRERILLLGSEPVTRLLAEHIAEQASLPLELVTVLSCAHDPANDGINRNAQLDSLIASFRPARIAIDRSCEGRIVSTAHLIDLRQRGVRIEDTLALFEAVTARVPISLMEAQSFAYGPSLSMTRHSARAHRFVDVLAASVLLLLSWPIFLLAALWIKLDSRGPIFYLQERVGLHGKLFRVIKLRSMRADAETGSGPVWAQQADTRITRSGRVLRMLRIDELPQLWNVLRGDMSLVGPRPERLHFVKLLRDEIPFYDLRHSVRPGVTGWAQVSAPYGASIAESLAKVEYDLFYLKNKSIAFNCYILFRTVKVCLIGRGSR